MFTAKVSGAPAEIPESKVSNQKRFELTNHYFVRVPCFSELRDLNLKIFQLVKRFFCFNYFSLTF